MPHRNRPPSYRHYKPKDLAVVRIKGKDHYLGKYDSPESWREYYRLIADHLAPAQRLNLVQDESQPKPPPLKVKKLCLLYTQFAESEYVKDGKPTGEVPCIKHSLRRLIKLFADKPAADFGPKALKMVRDEFVRDGLTRTTVNNNVARIKRMYRWAVENELVPVTTCQALATVRGLKCGRSSAPECKKVRPVGDDAIQASLPFMPPPIRAMVQLQRLTGCRPSEICHVRPCDIDQSGEVWCYKPQFHKTQHHECERRIYFGPRCQELLRPWLIRQSEAYCFSPKEWEQARRQAMHEARTTPLKYGNRPGTNRKNKPKRRPGERYTTTSYRKAIERACLTAKIDPWKPNQIRHTRATEVSKTADLDAARDLLGHTDPRVTETYAEKDFTKAAAFMLKYG
jgi:integrase